MDDKFKKFLELNRIFTQAKNDTKILLNHYIEYIQEEEIKEIYNKLMSDNKLDKMFEYVSEKIQDTFDEEFTELELDSLITIFSSPVMVKWLQFYNDIKPKISTSSTEWIEKNLDVE